MIRSHIRPCDATVTSFIQNPTISTARTCDRHPGNHFPYSVTHRNFLRGRNTSVRAKNTNNDEISWLSPPAMNFQVVDVGNSINLNLEGEIYCSASHPNLTEISILILHIAIFRQ